MNSHVASRTAEANDMSHNGPEAGGARGAQSCVDQVGNYGSL